MLILKRAKCLLSISLHCFPMLCNALQCIASSVVCSYDNTYNTSFKRLIVNKTVFQRLVRTDRKGKTFTDVNRFKRLVKKLCNVRVIDVEYSQLWCDFTKFLQILDLAVEYCEHLKEINIHFVNITEDQVNYVLKKFGNLIGSIEFKFQDNLRYYKNFSMINLHYCTNLKELSVIYLKHIFIGKNKSIENLKGLECVYFDEDRDKFQEMIELHKTSLESIAVFLAENILLISVNEFFDQIYKLNKLKKFHLYFHNEFENSLSDNLLQLSESCPLITDIRIRFYSYQIDNNMDIFTTMKHFPNLRKLYLTLYSRFEPEIDSYYTTEELQQCQHLTYVTIYSNNKCAINDLFFDRIHLNVPNLKHLSLWFANISGQALEFLLKLKRLERLKLCSLSAKQIMDYHVYNLIASCRMIKQIELENIELVDYQEIAQEYGIHDNNLIVFIKNNFDCIVDKIIT